VVELVRMEIEAGRLQNDGATARLPRGGIRGRGTTSTATRRLSRGRAGVEAREGGRARSRAGAEVWSRAGAAGEDVAGRMEATGRRTRVERAVGLSEGERIPGMR
jgi:hypothetical protein